VEYTCPLTEDDSSVCSQTDYIIHVLSGKKVWKTHDKEWVIQAGNTVYIKKGAFLIDQYFDDEFCMFGFFVPDDFIRKTINDISGRIPLCRKAGCQPFDAIEVQHNQMLEGFFSSMYPFFRGSQTPSPALLELKLKELVINVLTSDSNPDLSTYFQSLVQYERPSIMEIMERNFHYNLSMEEFAQLCHRSLSTFKRDFQQCYHETPGRWLLNKRLDFAAMLLLNKDLNISRTAYESGFENASHFSRAFKNKYQIAPNQYRATVTS
jgi:AraC-like DNA-binding protein